MSAERRGFVIVFPLSIYIYFPPFVQFFPLMISPAASHVSTWDVGCHAGGKCMKVCSSKSYVAWRRSCTTCAPSRLLRCVSLTCIPAALLTLLCSAPFLM